MGDCSMSGSTPILVVGYDRSAPSRRALVLAVELATRLNARLHVVHVVDLRDYPIDPDSADWEQQGRERLAAEFEAVKSTLTGWIGDWSYDVQRGDPARVLTGAAENDHAMMIIVGTRAESGIGAQLERLLGVSGSVSHALRHATVPVLVVPDDRGHTHRGNADP